MSQLEAFATFRRPLVQIANLTVASGTPQTVRFNFTLGTRSCTTTNASAVVTCSNTTDLSPGIVVSGTGIAANSRIVSIINNTSFTMDIAATASGTNTLSFAPFGAGGQIVRVRIANVSANPATLVLTDDGTTASPTANQTTTGTFAGSGAYAVTALACGTATTVVSGDGIRIQGNTTLEINITQDTRMWFAANAAGNASLNVVAIMQNG